jgi:hypothetical protein
MRERKEKKRKRKKATMMSYEASMWTTIDYNYNDFDETNPYTSWKAFFHSQSGIHAPSKNEWPTY